jgi:hypothetical protein
MIKTNTSCALLDIHKSKLAVAQLQSFSKRKKYVSLVSSTILSKIMFENHFQKGNCTQGHNCNTKCFYNPKLGYINFWVSLIREVGCWLVEPFCVYDSCLCITSAWGLPFGLCGVFLLGDLLDGCY